MKHLKALGFSAMTAMALLILGTVGTASATTLEVGAIPVSKSVSVVLTLNAGSSLVLKDTSNATVDTCGTSEIKAASQSPFSGTTVTAPLSSLTLSSCSHTAVATRLGTFHVAWSAGTNGTVVSSGWEITFQSTIFGASCFAKTGSGTKLGTITGVKEGQATMHMNGVIPMGLCGDAVWTGTYAVTSPAGLGVVA
jgi:hypothetical protein